MACQDGGIWSSLLEDRKQDRSHWLCEDQYLWKIVTQIYYIAKCTWRSKTLSRMHLLCNNSYLQVETGSKYVVFVVVVTCGIII